MVKNNVLYTMECKVDWNNLIELLNAFYVPLYCKYYKYLIEFRFAWNFRLIFQPARRLCSMLVFSCKCFVDDIFGDSEVHRSGICMLYIFAKLNEW